MKIAVAGGLGFERELLEALGGHSVYLIGSGYDLKKEKFVFSACSPSCTPSGADFTAEYLTHNYRERLSEQDILIDVSENRKSKYIMNDAAVAFNKKLIALIWMNGWKAAVVDPASGSGCLQCAAEYSKPVPPFSLPEAPAEEAIRMVAGFASGESGSFLYDFQSGEKKKIDRHAECGAMKGSYRFLNGEMADVSAVSCSDNSVAVTPMNELALDLGEYRSLLEGKAKILKQSPYFLQFKIGKFDCTLFRLGRMVIRGTKEKNSALHIYRNYVGS